MKQPEDTKTIDLLDQVKRGRGRPRVENPLTPAERARRYRLNKKTSDANAKSTMAFIRDEDSLQRSNEQQKKDLSKFWSLNDEVEKLRLENVRLSQEIENRDAVTVTKSSDQVFMLEMRIQQLESDLGSYRQFDEQRRQDDELAQSLYNDLFQENKKLKIALEKRDAETVTENNDALYWEEMYKAEASRVAELEKRSVPKGKGGQKLHAKIKRSSKYFGQTSPGEMFSVFVEARPGGEYVVQGGPGGQYRLADVNLFVVGDDGASLRIS